MARISPASRGYVPIGTVEIGLDNEYWERVPRANTSSGVWQKTQRAKRLLIEDTKTDFLSIEKKIQKESAQSRKRHQQIKPRSQKPKAKTKPKVTKPTIEEGKRAKKRAKESYEKFVGVKLF